MDGEEKAVTLEMSRSSVDAKQNSAPLREPVVCQVADCGPEKYPDLCLRFPLARPSEIRTAVTKGVEFVEVTTRPRARRIQCRRAHSGPEHSPGRAAFTSRCQALHLIFSVRQLVARRAITGHPARDLLLDCLRLLGHRAGQRPKVVPRDVESELLFAGASLTSTFVTSPLPAA